MKYTGEALQNLTYFWRTKLVVFQRYGKIWNISLRLFVLISEDWGFYEKIMYGIVQMFKYKEDLRNDILLLLQHRQKKNFWGWIISSI